MGRPPMGSIRLRYGSIGVSTTARPPRRFPKTSRGVACRLRLRASALDSIRNAFDTERFRSIRRRGEPRPVRLDALAAKRDRFARDAFVMAPVERLAERLGARVIAVDDDAANHRRTPGASLTSRGPAGCCGGA
jgi:hypothetical protein